MTRLDYLLRQYETLSAVSQILGEIAGTPPPFRLAETDLRSQLEKQQKLIGREDPGLTRRALGQIGGALYEAQEQLHEFDNQISVFQFRTRFQQAETSRADIGVTLQFMLSKLNFTETDFEKIDYLTTRFYALSIRTGGGFSFENKVRQEYQQMLDYAGITKMDTPDPEGLESLDYFREEIASATSFQQLAANETLDRFRAFKAGLEKRRLHPDVMVELARVNLLAGERFDQIARRASRLIENLATRLLSAGVSEADELKDVETTLVEEVLKDSLRDASQLNEDYRQNRQRIERLARTNDALARASQRLGLNAPVIPAVALESSDAVSSPAAASAGFTLSPAQFHEALQERLQQMTSLLREKPDADPASNAEVELNLGESALILQPWETAAFQKNYPGLRAGENSLGSLLRLSVALMAELRQKEELLCRSLRLPHRRSNTVSSAHYLTMFSRRMLHELDHHSRAALPPELSRQFQQTRRRLAAACTEFSAKLQECAV
ncbi:MAG TPA: hypothetical protein VNQ79_22425 [Blastocatellia bacterium]|nr:hypothetical protein [Blastocatellia bacterium]